MTITSMLRPACHTALAAVAVVALAPAIGSAQRATGSPKILAQQLVDDAHARHPEVDEIGISATTAKGCVGVASTDRSDVGEKCESDDVLPLKTGKPSVGKEGGGFDVSVVLHDATGHAVGVLGVGFKAAAGQTEASVTAATEAIEKEMAPRIPSKARLLARAN